MELPRVSVITATYNRSRVLRHAIASVIAQRFTDWELLVIGDACTDDTEDVVAAFRDPRIRFHQLPRNVGEQSGPNNEGASRARGELLAYLNHDDLWLPDHLERLVPALARSGAGLMFSLMAAIIPGQPPVLGNFTPSGRYEPRTVVPASSWLFRRTLTERVGPWRSYRDCYQAPSQDWLYRAHARGCDLRLEPALTVVAFPSGYRRGSYVDGDDGEHRAWAERIRSNPAFREDLLTDVALGQAREGPYAVSSTAVLPYLSRAVKNAARATLSAVGVPPASVRLFLTSPRKGAFIDSLRHARGLPELSRRRSEK